MMIRRASFLLLLAFLLSTSGCAAANRQGDPEYFGIYTSTLSGAGTKLIIGDPVREMTHPRVSPDGKWVTFTRYNRKGLNGLASEEGFSYQLTEIMLMRANGSKVRSIVPPKRGVINANSSWTPDGKSIIYLSTDTPGNKPRIKKIDLQSSRISDVDLPAELAPTDPHLVRGRYVFPVREAEPKGLWTMEADGSNLRRLTRPKMAPGAKGKGPLGGGFLLGDYDPRISPDAKRVAFMRYMGKENWHIVVVDVANGKEKDLSGKKTIDILPAWSSDGKVIIFWHANRQAPRKIGLYTMRPDGSDRTMIPLPRGFVHKHPAFFPGGGSSPKARIIFAAKKDPNIR